MDAEYSHHHLNAIRSLHSAYDAAKDRRMGAAISYAWEAANSAKQFALALEAARVRADRERRVE